MLMTHRPRRPRARPDLRIGTTAFVAEQWGRRWITIDTSRVALALAGSESWARGTRGTCWPTRAEGHAKESESRRRSRCRRRAVDGRHPARVRLRARPAHHAEVDREQPGHQGGDDPRGDRRGDQAACRLRAALRQALRGQEEGPRRRPVHGRVAEPAPLARLRRRPDESRLARPRPPRTPTHRTSSSRSSTTSRRPASRTAAGRSGSSSRRSRPTPASTSRRSASDGETDGDAPTRIAIAIGPQYGTVSPSYVKKAAREAIDAEDVDLLCDPRLRLRPAGHRRDRGRRRHRRGLRRGLRQRRGRAQARPHPGADGADERRPAHGRGAQEDRRRQPLHRLRRARHRRSTRPRTARSSSISRASTSTTRRPARCAATAPTRSRSG